MKYPSLRMYYRDFLFTEMKPRKYLNYQKVNGKWTSFGFKVVTDKDILKMLKNQPCYKSKPYKRDEK